MPSNVMLKPISSLPHCHDMERMDPSAFKDSFYIISKHTMQYEPGLTGEPHFLSAMQLSRMGMLQQLYVSYTSCIFVDPLYLPSGIYQTS